MNYFLISFRAYTKPIYRFLILSVIILFSFVSDAQIQLITASDGGFESSTKTFAANGWQVVNGGTNNWYIGSAAKYSGNNGAYIDDGGGSTNKYDFGTFNNSHFYRDITVPAFASNITLTFMLSGRGELNWDRLLVYTAPTSVTPTVSIPAMWSSTFPGATLVYSQPAYYNSFTNQTINLPNSLAGTTFRLIFTWQNDNNTGNNPAAAVDNISLTYTPCTNPTPAYTSTQSCIGGSTGSIKASAIGGNTPYTYSLDGVNYQSGNTFTGLAAGSYTVYVKSAAGCSSSIPATVSDYSVSSGNQNLAGTNSWIGHMYDGMNFDSYSGTFTENESFDEDFGGYTNCFPITSSSGSSSIYTETFSTRFRMTSTKNGLYIFDLGSDDGSRLYVDNILVYNNWNLQAFSNNPGVLMNLNGNSSLVYEYYDNSSANRVAFTNPRLILSNNLSSGVSQNLCPGGTAATISGDAFGTLPSGLSNPKYQWSYSTTLGGTRSNLANGTSATFTPDLTKAPFSTTGTYYVYRSASVTSSNNTGLGSYTATNLSNPATIAIDSKPTVSSTNTPTCVGAPYGTGTITVSASGGKTPYTFSLNGGGAQSSNLFSSVAAGTYSVSVTTTGGCSASTSGTIIPYPNSSDDQNATGTDSWVGHVYDLNFNNYKGNFTESETFDEGFGGDYNCFSINSGGSSSTIYTENFSVKFKMNSTKKGFYTVDLGSDDGSRFYVDNNLVYNDWTDHGFTSRPGVLINLTGSSNLQYEYYEKGVNNRVVFQNLIKILENTLTSSNQTVCLGSTGSAISGDVYGSLPAGISKSGTGYQWTYSNTAGGARIAIPGATGATFTPNTLAAPFNFAGTYYIYRNAVLTSSNNVSPNPYTATNESNAVILTVTQPASATISYTGSPFCKSVSGTQPVSQTGTSGGTYSAPAGLTINASTGAITPSSSTPGNYTVTYSMAAAGGCVVQTAATSVTITAIPSATISYAGSPYCSSAGSATPSITGTTGGSFSSDVGLSIDGSTGVINLASSTIGYHTITYKIAAAGGCAAFSTTTSITITQQPSATGFYPASPYCSNIGTLIPAGSKQGADGVLSASPSGLSINPTNGVINVSASTPGNYTVYYTVPAQGGCAQYVASAPLTISTAPNAIISYSGSPYCAGSGNATVNITGSGTGTFSSTAGLTIDGNSGQVNLNSSTPGYYTVTYTVPASNGCSLYKSTTGITINPKVQTPVFALGASSTRCQSAQTIMYSATAVNSTGITYSLDAASIAGGNIINSNTGELTFSAGWAGTTIITATAAGCSPLTATHTVTVNETPSISALSPTACVGTNGSITINASGGQTPYTFSIGGSYQSGATFNNVALGNYTVSVKTAKGCISSTTVQVSTYPASTDNEAAAGNDTWIGHIYSGKNFDYYVGYFSEPRNFSEDFGGSTTCYSASSSSGSSSVYTENFSARFLMNSSLKGLYVADLGSDDGGRLSIDGTLVYNNWTNQSYNIKPRVLLNLSGSSLLSYEYYEQTGANKISFDNLNLVLANSLTSANQSICLGSTGTAITGDSFGTLPSGLSNGRYQWTYSTTAGGARINILGATGATFTPDGSTAPFNAAGTYYVYRNATITSNNNYGINPYNTTIESNPVLVTVSAPSTATIQYADAPFCNTISTAQLATISGTSGGIFTAPAGVAIDPASGAITPNLLPIGIYTITYTVPATGGCASFSTTTCFYVGAPGSWSGKVDTNWSNPQNWLCGQVPGLTTDAIIPSKVNNFPTVISNTAQAKDLIIKTGASLVIQGTIKIAGNIINSGDLNLTEGTLEMNGNASQTIAGSQFKNNTIKNLVVSNTSSNGLSVGSALNDTLKITGTLSFGSSIAKLYTGNNITLVSNKFSTANVGKLSSKNSINGNVTVERYINIGTGAGQHPKSWQFLATPTNGQTIRQSWMENGTTPANYGTQVTGAGGTAAGFDLYTATPSLKYYNPQNDSWTGVTSTNNPVYLENGYMIFVRGDRTVTAYNQPANNTTLRTTGQLLTGTLPAISVPTGSFQSIGNPYASAIDFTGITKDAGVDNLFYVWDPYLYGAYGLGGYQTLSATNGWKPVPGGTQAYPTGIPCTTIQSGQAFFVHASQSAMAVQTFSLMAAESTGVTFSENCKVDASKTRNFAREADFSDNSSQFLRVSLFTSAGENGLMADGNTIAFNQNYTRELDGNDAIKIKNAGENFGIKSSNKLLSIEARPNVDQTDTIYYNMSNLSQRTYQLRFAPENMNAAALQATLYDKFLNTYTPISLTDSSFVNITINSNAGSSAADRFKIIFRQMAPLSVNFVSIKAAYSAKNIRVEWKVDNESDMDRYIVEKSANGNNFTEISSVKANNNSGSQTYSSVDVNPFEGDNYYRIKGIGKDGKITYTKVVKVAVDKTVAEMTVSPNQIINGIITLKMSNQPAGNYGIKLINAIGQVMYVSKLAHSDLTNIEIISVGNVAKGIYQLEILKPDGTIQVIKLLK